MNARVVRWGAVGVLAFSVLGIVTACTTDEPATAPTSDVTCNNYCTKILADCTGKEAMYRDMDQCTAACKALDPANQIAATGNTVRCRQAQLDAKSCKGAGVLGGGVCGDRCDAFCKVVQASCSKQPAPPYPDLGTCIEECNTVLRFDPNAPEGVEQPFTGEDTLNCRVQHLLLSFKDPTPHCNHVAVQSAQCRTIADAGAD